MPRTYITRLSLLVLATLQQMLALGQPTADSKPSAANTVNPVPTGYASGMTGIPVNYVRSWAPHKPYINETDVTAETDVNNVSRSTQYLDGLGRPLQTVGWQASPNKTDIVVPILYDAFGREEFKYLPYTSAASTGTFRNDPFNEQSAFYSASYPGQQPALAGEQVFYGKTAFEASPLNRPVKSFAPGNSWAGSEGSAAEHAANIKYLLNDPNDAVQLWAIASDYSLTTATFTTLLPITMAQYPVGTLYKTVTIDESGHATVDYKDLEGQPVLKKVQVGNSVPADFSGQDGSWLCTYYVYDDYGVLRFVMPPMAVQQLQLPTVNWQVQPGMADELCYHYEYDQRARVIAKKVPGSGWVYMVYDTRNRLVFMQDANMAAKGQWAYTLYDGIDRQVQTGIMAGYPGSRDDLQAYVNGLGFGGSNITTSGSLTGSSLPADLTVTSRVSTVSDYRATHSIIVDGGNGNFVSEDGATFIMEITQGQASSFATAQTVSQDPRPSGTTSNGLTLSFYDNYSQTSKSYSTANSNYLSQGGNVYTDQLPGSASSMTTGMATVNRVRVLEDPNDLTKGAWMETAIFYNDKGRTVQGVADNYKGGTDITTSLLDFAGKPVSTYQSHSNPAAGTSVAVLTNITYDHGERVTMVTKQLDNNPATLRTILVNSYDALGMLLVKKTGQKRTDATTLSSTAPLSEVDYSYNIRGWLKGLNWGGYNSGTATSPQMNTANNKWFSMDLSYDWGYNANQYSSNIAGQRWQSAGDGAERSYGYGYDPANRLLFADFEQNFGGGNSPNWNVNDPSNTSFNIDFGLKMGSGLNDGSAYDANGNVLAIWQKGLKLNTSSVIDDLHYTYTSNSNKLQNVVDFMNDPATILGDFRTSGLHPQAATKSTITSLSAYNTSSRSITDYNYDGNGNMTKDLNKDIGTGTADGIVYNHLNLPWKVSVNSATGGKGSITYIYDAIGSKLEKRTAENASIANGNTAKNTATTYIGNYVYQNNVLQFLGHDEGRIRPTPRSQNGQPYAYDFFVKDHLGNTRSVLTDEFRYDNYPTATLEDLSKVTEGIYYGITDNSTTIYDISQISGYGGAAGQPYANNNGTPANPNLTGNALANSTKMYRLNGKSGVKTGLGITLRVMAGDHVDIMGKSYWKGNGASQQDNSYSVPVTALLTVLAGSSAVMSSGEYATAAALTGSPVTPGELQNFLGNNEPATGSSPKAYINWIMFDDQFRPVGTGTNSGFDPVGAADQIVPHSKTADITKNGYLYVYCSNESDQDVFFDNLQVAHTRGPLLEETHYYPFGLTMAGISSKASGALENKFKYNKGSELQSGEFSDGSGLELYATNFRSLDPQLGRWWQIDPVFTDGVDPDDEESMEIVEGMKSQSPYASMDNNPISHNDPKGDCPSCVIGGIIGFVTDAVIQVGTSITKSVANGESPSLSTVWRDYSGTQALAATGAGIITGGVSAYEESTTVALAKTALVNASFSAGNQIADNKPVDPMQVAIAAIPIPEVKGGNLLNVNNAEKAVAQAQNRIAASTSAVPERKLIQLGEAQAKVAQVKTTNAAANSTVSSLRENTVRQVGSSIATPGTGGKKNTFIPPPQQAPVSDNTRAPIKIIPPSH